MLRRLLSQDERIRMRGPADSSETKQRATQIVDAAAAGNMDVLKMALRTAGERDPAVFRAYRIIVERMDEVALAAMTEAGANLDDTDVVGNTVMDYAFEFYRETTNGQLLQMMGYLAMHMNTIRVLQALRRYVRQKEFDPAGLHSLCRCVVAGSHFPMTTSLQVAHFFHELAEWFPVHANAFTDSSAQFTDTAITMLNDIETDHLAALMLYQKDALDASAMSVALSSNNKKFIGDGRVVRIVNTLWSKPYFMIRNDFTNDATRFQDLVSVLMSQPENFFKLPIGKFILETSCFIIFLLMFTWVVDHRIKVGEHIHSIEYVLWFFVFSFVFEQLNTMYSGGLIAYFGRAANIFDLIICAVFVGIVAIRVSAPHHTNSDDAGGALYDVLISANSVMLWLRVSYVFAIHPTVGPLLRMLARMLTDVKNFIILMVVFIVGFSLAFYFLLSEEIPGDYSTIPATLYTLFQALVGNADWDSLGTLHSHARRLFAKLLLMVFLFAGVIMALNIFIAMLSETYGDVQDDSLLEFIFGRTELIDKFDQSTNILPPPLNGPVYALYFLSRLADGVVAVVTGSAFRSKPGLTQGGADQDPAAWYAAQKSAQDGRMPLLPTSAARDSFATPLPEGFDDVPPFYCGYCHCYNDATSFRAVRTKLEVWATLVSTRFGEVRARSDSIAAERSSSGTIPDIELKQAQESRASNGSVEKDADDAGTVQLELVPPTIAVCKKCMRPAKQLDTLERRKEVISFYLFLAVLYVPIFMLLLLPFLFVYFLNAARDMLERSKIERNNKRVAESIRQSQIFRRLQQKSGRDKERDLHKAAWVQQMFVKPAPTIEDVYGKVEELHDKMKKIRFRSAGDAPPSATTR